MHRTLVTTSALLSLVALLAAEPAAGRTEPNPEGRAVRDPLAPFVVDGGGTLARGAAPVSLPAGAVQLDSTYYDLQDMGSLGTHVVVTQDGTVHVTWQDDFCELDEFIGCPPDESEPNPFPTRANAYAVRDAGGVWSATERVSDPSIHGCCVTEEFGGFGSLALTADGRGAIAQHMNEDGCDLRADLYIEDVAGGGTYKAYLSPITSPSYLFPQAVAVPGGSFVLLGEIPRAGLYDEVEEFRVSVLPAEGPDFVCPTGVQFGSWTSVVSSGLFRDGTPAFPSIAAADDGRVGIAVGDFGGDVFLVESSDGSFDGGTITVTNLTEYDDADVTAPDASSNQFRPYIHCDLAYHGDTPHVVWSELQARRSGSVIFYVDHRSRIRHWSPSSGISTVKQVQPGEADTYDQVDEGGSGPLPGFNTISVDWPQVGFSPGGEIYVAWLRFVDDEVDPTADMGLPGIVTGVGYGDVAAAVSQGGGVWSEPQNLTATPNADERYFSLADYNPGARAHVVFQASATDEAGTVLIGDRGVSATFLRRRIAYLERSLDAAVSVPSASAAGEPSLAVMGNPAPGRVAFTLPPAAGEGEVIAVYAATGRRVATVAVGAGRTAATWDGTTAAGTPAPGGVYLARLEPGGGPAVKFALVR